MSTQALVHTLAIEGRPTGCFTDSSGRCCAGSTEYSRVITTASSWAEVWTLPNCASTSRRMTYVTSTGTLLRAWTFPFVRRFLEDREVNAWFLLDLSPSMTFGALHRRKESVLVDFVGVVARLLTRNGNRVGAILYDNNTQVTIPPRGGRLQVLRLINDIQRQQSSPAGAMTDLSKLLKTAFNCIKRRSLVFLVSDFICVPGWDKAMDQLNRRHELLTVRLWDPRERDLPDVGVVLVEDSETGAQLSIDTSDRGFRRRFHEASRHRETELAQTFKRAGVDQLPLSTQDDLVLAIVRFASLRRRARMRQFQGV